MKKLSLILVALATMVMVGCKPLTDSTVCTHNWVLTDDVAPTCVADGVKTYTCTLCDKTKEDPVEKLDHSGWSVAKEVKSVSYDMQTGLTDKTTIDCYGEQCLICNKYPNKKTDAFFDSPTTIGVATDVSKGRFDKLPIDEELTMFYNSYYENRNTYSNNCNCGGECVNYKCDCNKLTCIRRVPTDRNTNILYFGSYYIEY